MTTRRHFLTASSAAAMAALGRSSLPAAFLSKSGWGRPGLAGPDASAWDVRATDPQLKELAMRALDAAKSAGATYADIRFTRTRRRAFRGLEPATDSTAVAVGVRALAKGAWGFAAASEWTPEVIARLGNTAADQAQANAWPHVPPIELIDRPPVAVGNWQMPVKRDPFTVPLEEVADLLQSMAESVKQLGGQMGVALVFACQERTFASTDGAFVTQTVYNSLGGIPHTNIASYLVVGKKGTPGYRVPFVSPSGLGYEVIEDANILDHLSEWLDRADAQKSATPFKLPGWYDVVFDAHAVAALVSGTFGAALEYDRAVGTEADAGGTSYLAPPAQILGDTRAPASVTITADRTLPGGVATVKWDDDGVAPQAAPLVKEGVVVDYATSREFVPELAAWYRAHGLPVRSNGCAASESALAIPLIQTPNLVLHPAATDTSVDALVAGIDDGLAIFGGDIRMDMQQMSGQGTGATVYAVKKGKLAGQLTKSAYAFTSKELWKNLVALGGAQTAAMRGLAAVKGQPDQIVVHSVQAVAARFQKVKAERTGEG